MLNNLKNYTRVFLISFTMIVSSLIPSISLTVNAQERATQDEGFIATPYMDENGNEINNLEEAVTKEGKEFWLETTNQMPTTVIENENSIIMKNAVIERKFNIPQIGSTEFYSKSYKNLYTEQEFLKEEVKPDVYIGLYDKPYHEIYDYKTINFDPEYYYVGGIQNSNTFIFDGYEIFDECEKPFEWTPDKSYSDPSVGEWPPSGKRVVFKFTAPDTFKEAYQGIRIKVIYEMYDGISAMKKRVEITNTSEHVITVGKLAPEVLNAKEDMKDQIHMETTYTCGTESTVPINTELPCGCKNEKESSSFKELPDMVHACYEIGPGYELNKGEEFITYDVYELLHSTYWFENKCKEIKGMYKKLFPWTTDNPITFHCTKELTKDVIDHAAEAGFEMMIQSYAAPDISESMLTRNVDRLNHYKELIDYAHTKGIDIGIYQAQYTLGKYRNNGASYGSNDIGQWGTWCMASVAFDDYWDNFKHFVEYTGVDCVEIDGAYPGSACDNGEEHINKDRETDPGDSSSTTTGNESKYKVHNGYYDSVVKQWENAVRMLTRTMRDLDVYVKLPAWYYLNGGNKGAIGYEEIAWSQPRHEQLLYGRQIIYNSSYGKNTSLSWSHIPFVQYHGGGDAAAFKPFREHLDDYNWVLAQNLGNGVTSDYRGDTLYDNESLPIMKKWVDFYKRHRGIINSDMIKISQAAYEEGSDRQSTTKLDTLYHVNSQNDGEKGLLWVYNQSDEERTEVITVPMYYTGLTDMSYPNIPLKGSLGKNVKRYGKWPPNYSWIPSEEPNYSNETPDIGVIRGYADFVKEGVNVQNMPIDSNGNVMLEVTLPPMSFTYYTIYEQGQVPETTINVGKVNNVVLTSNTEHSISLSWDKDVEVTVIQNGEVCPDEPAVDYFNVYRNGELAGSSITNDFVDETLSENTSFSYTVEAVVADTKGIKSDELVAKTLVDTVNPNIINVIPTEQNRIKIIFNEPIDEVSGSNIENYIFTENISAINSKVHENEVILTVDNLIPMKTYTLTVKNVKDRSAASNVVDTKVYNIMYGYISSYPLDSIVNNKTPEIINHQQINIKNATIVKDAIGDVTKFDSNKRTYADLGTNLIKNDSDYSISMWINTTDISKQILISQGQDEIAENDFTVHIEDGIPKFNISNSDNTKSVNLISEKRINLGEWNNIIVSCNGYSYAMYLNGDLVAEISTQPIAGNYHNALYLGAITNSAGGDKIFFYNGLMSDVEIFKIGLTKEQVDDLYYSNSISSKNALAKAAYINEKYYTDNSYSIYEEAFTQLKIILENDDYDVNEAVNALDSVNEARDNLQLLDEYESAVSIYPMDEEDGNEIIDVLSGDIGNMPNGEFMRLYTPFDKGIYINETQNNLIEIRSPIKDLDSYSIMGWFKYQPRDDNDLNDEYAMAGKQFLLSDNQLNLYIEDGKLHLDIWGKENNTELISNESIKYDVIGDEKRQAFNSFAITRENDDFILYQNGIEVARGTQDNVSDSTSNMYIGSDMNEDNILNGIVDEFVFYNEAVNKTKIDTFTNNLGFDKGRAANISIGKEIFSNDMTDGYRINDGKVLDLAGKDTPWSARKSNVEKLMYGIDLGKEYSIDAVSFTQFYRPYGQMGYGQAGFRYYNTVIQVSAEEDFSSDVITVFNNDINNELGLGNGEDKLFVSTELGNDIVLDEPVVGRYIRLYNSGFYTPDDSNMQSYINVVELEAYGRDNDNQSSTKLNLQVNDNDSVEMKQGDQVEFTITAENPDINIDNENIIYDVSDSSLLSIDEDSKTITVLKTPITTQNVTVTAGISVDGLDYMSEPLIVKVLGEIETKWQNLSVRDAEWILNDNGEFIAPITGKDEVLIRKDLTMSKGVIQTDVFLGADNGQKQGLAIGWGNDTSDGAKQQGYEILISKDKVAIEKSGIGILKAKEYIMDTSNWVNLKTEFQDGLINVYVDDVLLIEYRDNVNIVNDSYVGLFANMWPYNENATSPKFRNVDFGENQ